MTQCLTCWRESKSGPRCDTCTKGDGLNAPMKPWDGSHPPPKEEDETMTDYTERFRTLSIPQMQQVLAVLCELATDPWVGHSVKGRIGSILAQADPPAQHSDESRIIRSGDLVVGKRYRIAAIAEWDQNPSHNVGEVVECDNATGLDVVQVTKAGRGAAWLCGPRSSSDERYGTWVTAVEPVEDEAVSPCDVGGSCGCAATADPTIIRAAEGVTLEPGEYEIVAIAEYDESPDHSVGQRVHLSAQTKASWYYRGWRWFFDDADRTGTWVTAVRRVDPKPASEPCNHSGDVAIDRATGDEICCDCGASNAASEPVATPAGGERAHTCETYGADIVDPSCPGCAPPQQPAERVEPVAELASALQSAGARVTIDADLAKAFSALNAAGFFISAASDGGDYPNSILSGLDSVRAALTVSGNMRRERDAALATVAKLESELERHRDADGIWQSQYEATVAKLTAELADERAKHEDLRQRVAQTIDHRNRIEDVLEENIAKLTAELEAARIDVRASSAAGQLQDGELQKRRLKIYELASQLAEAREQLHQLESSRAGLDPKACGELIATVTQGVGTANQLRASVAFAAIDKLAAMLGVEKQR